MKKENEIKLLKQQNKQKDEVIHDLDKYNYRGQCETLKIENKEHVKSSPTVTSTPDETIKVSPATVLNTVAQFSKKSKPVLNEMKEKVLKEPVINEDETPINVNSRKLKEDTLNEIKEEFQELLKKEYMIDLDKELMKIYPKGFDINEIDKRIKAKIEEISNKYDSIQKPVQIRKHK